MYFYSVYHQYKTRSSTIERNGRSMLLSIPWWSSFNAHMISTIEITKLSIEYR